MDSWPTAPLAALESLSLALLVAAAAAWPGDVCVCERVWREGEILPISAHAALGSSQMAKERDSAVMGSAIP